MNAAVMNMAEQVSVVLARAVFWVPAQEWYSWILWLIYSQLREELTHWFSQWKKSFPYTCLFWEITGLEISEAIYILFPVPHYKFLSFIFILVADPLQILSSFPVSIPLEILENSQQTLISSFLWNLAASFSSQFWPPCVNLNPLEILPHTQWLATPGWTSGRQSFSFMHSTTNSQISTQP